MYLENKIRNLDELPLSLSVSDIAKVLNISKHNAYILCHNKDFPSVRVGKRIIIPKPAFQKWIENPKV